MDWPSLSPLRTPIICSLGVESMGGLVDHANSQSQAASTWPSANLAIAMPLRIEQFTPIVKAWWSNGATAAGNLDLGVYTDDLSTLIASLGSTAMSGANQMKSATLTTGLPPGRYYLAFASDSATAQYGAITGSVSVATCALAGMVQMASAFPLPAAFTPATIGQVYIPQCGLSARSTI